MHPAVGEKRVQSRHSSTPRVAPQQDNNTTMGSPEPTKRVITQKEFNSIEETIKNVQQFLKNLGSGYKAQALGSALQQLRNLPKLTPERQCLEKLTNIV